MWTAFPGGFVSVVEKPADQGNDTLTVRARDKKSLAAYLTIARGVEVSVKSIKLNIATDYPYRAAITREEGDRAALAIMHAITYDNFKNEAKRVRGAAYAGVLGRVWTALLGLEDKATRDAINGRWASPLVTGGTTVQPGDDDWDAILDAAARSQQELDEIVELDGIVSTLGVNALTDEQWARYEALGG